LRAEVEVTGAPIRRKKSSALSTGTPESCCLTLQGHPTHVPRRVLAQRVACRALLALAFPGEPSPLRLVPSQRLAILPAPGEAESGSAGVQPDKEYPGRRCAAGASPLKDSSFRGLFVGSSGHRSHAFENALRELLQASRRVLSAVRYGRWLFAWQAIVSPMHLSGTLPGEVHEDNRA
jgi:hypothetical protein